MSKTYTFPTQQVIGGELSFEVRTSSGSGTEAIADKYFSSEVSVTDETEFLGGELQSQYADFVIDFDKDNLFRDTIFASLSGVVDNDEFVAVKVSLNGAVIFHGNIVPSTIDIQPFHSDADNIEESKNTISFRCVWVLGLLRYISAEEVGNKIVLSPTVSPFIPRYKEVTANDGLGTQMKFVSLISIMERCLELLNSLYGFTVQMNIETDLPYVFYSKDRIVPPQQNDRYVYPPGITEDGNVDFARISDDLYGVGVVLTKGDGTLGGIFQSVIVDSDGNNQENPNYAETAYNLFVGVLKSFGLYANVNYSGTTIIVDVKTRITGTQKNLTEILSAQVVPFSELSRDAVEVSSKISGNTYKKIFDAVGDSTYSAVTTYDFANNFDMPGGADPLNSIYSLMFPYSNAFMLIRDCGILPNLISNSHFNSDISGWTAVSGTWVWSAPPVGAGMGSGSMRLALGTGNSVNEVTTPLPRTVFDYLIVSAFFYVTNVTINLTSSAIEVDFVFYDADDNELFTTFGQFELKDLSYPKTAFRNNKTMFKGTCRMPNRTSIGVAKVGIRIEGVDITGSGFIYVDRVNCYIDRKGTPELVGALVEDYFANGKLERRQYVVNGARSDIRCGDFIYPNNQKYYVKKNKYSLRNNETELEVINYPY